jgi:LCP family protein required for cell wall assembly
MAAPDPPTGRTRYRRTWPQRVVLAFNVVLVALCLGAAGLVWYANRRVNEIERVVITHASVTLPTASGDGAPAPTSILSAPTKAQNFLIIGSDNRKEACVDPNSPYAKGFGDSSGALSDTVMMVRYDPDAAQAAILSFPRDLWVTIAGTERKAKINSAYRADDPSVLVQTIEENFGVRVDHTIEVSFCAFKSLVDDIGGIRIPFAYPTKSDETGFNVPAGCVQLTGDQALAYVRIRKDYEYLTDRGWQTDETSDYGRIARQQDFLQRALQKAIDKGARNLSVAKDLLDVALEPGNVRIDSELTINDLLELAGELRKFDAAALRAHSYRVEGKLGIRGTESVVTPTLDAPTTRKALEVFRGKARLADTSSPTTTATTSATSTTNVPAPGGSTSTLPVVSVAPNPSGVVPPADPGCR